MTHQPPSFHSTTSLNFSATNIIGELPDSNHTSNTIDSSTFVLNENINDLRKTIVSDLIKNPKIFKRGKDSVKNELMISKIF